MGVLLKVDEWETTPGWWFVADVHTWTNWRTMAEILGVADNIEDFMEFLQHKYKAVVDLYNEEKDFLMFHWVKSDYKNAHQFKLDVNRIARKKNYLV